MASYSVVRLNVNKKELIGMDRLRQVERNALSMQNAVYIYRGKKSKKVYIGQTVHFTQRHKQHYNGTDERFEDAKFNEVIVIFSRYFNKSALDDVESQLITYFTADNEKSKKAVVEYDTNEVVNTSIVTYSGILQPMLTLDMLQANPCGSCLTGSRMTETLIRSI